MLPSCILCRAPDPDPASDAANRGFAAEQSLSSGDRLLEVFDRSDGVLYKLRILILKDRFQRIDSIT